MFSLMRSGGRIRPYHGSEIFNNNGSIVFPEVPPRIRYPRENPDFKKIHSRNFFNKFVGIGVF